MRSGPAATTLTHATESPSNRIAASDGIAADYFDRHNMGVILIRMPGIEKRLARYPQLYIRIGFAREDRPLTPDELTAVSLNDFRPPARRPTVVSVMSPPSRPSSASPAATSGSSTDSSPKSNAFRP